ncbi:hypothetical protein FGO68_gene1233 [Halteria grandinella]|uniref:Uncharacterized protein n=1 Tax=Halteria grandinella TaxID=5974 RepID=A0A8J8NK71_HALGN|nr:hypothetical protein FGO68_gene1233 [Halteria grandinella]
MRTTTLFAATILIGVATAQADFVIPNNIVARGRVADLNAPTSVYNQWRFGAVESKFAWDIPTGCLSESYYNNSDVSLHQVYCKGAINSYGLDKKCTTVKTSINATVLINGLKTMFSVYEGTVSDPFIRANPEKFELYRTPTEDEWVWIRKSDKQMVYWQRWRADVKRIIVLYYGEFDSQGMPINSGFAASNEAASYYDFKVWRCAK